MGGIAIFFGKKGFISADYEFIDYSLAYFDFTAYSSDASDQLAATAVNSTINKKYGKAESFRLGSEFILTEKFAVRAGYAYYGDPFRVMGTNEDVDRSRQVISLGFGFKEDDYFFDFAYRKILTSDFYLPYSLSSGNETGVTNHLDTGGLSMTIGMKF